MTKEEYDANDGAQKYINGLKGRELGVIPAGIYGDNVNARGDVYTLAAAVGIIVRKDMSDDQVYTMTKAFWDNVEAARASTPWLAHVTLEYAVKEGGMSLHPGAIRYYKEAGVEIPAGSM
jgi:uncharacterized protein